MVTRVWGLLTAGLLGTVLGLLWIFEGQGLIEGSRITDDPVWSIVGGVVLALGLILIVVGVRLRAKRGLPPASARQEDLPITERPASISMNAGRQPRADALPVREPF